jgi:hypothetical protein
VVVVNEDEAAAVATPVGVGVDVLVDRAVVALGIVEAEIGRAGERRAAPQERDDRPGEVVGMRLVDGLVPTRLPELHPVALAEAFDLAVAQHRQAG